MECMTCGGKEFYKDLGYFYCLECQTQSQDVREHEFQEEVRNKTGKKVHKPPKDKEESKITSWECYNIILHSLTNQLIELGANHSLKTVVKTLWIAYLEKLQVLDLQVDAKPRLPAVNLKRDVQILYDLKKKRRKRKKSTSDESSSHTDAISSYSSLKRERTKRKSALVQAEYTESSFRLTQESSFQGTETLTSLKSSSATEENTLQFSSGAQKELRRKLSKSHITEHQKDVELAMKCHKMTYKDRTRKYLRSVQFVSPEKLYCVLYLGLLIIKDEIQVGDLLRFVREGHLSFNNYTHLLQDDMSDRILGIQTNPKNTMLTHKAVRTTTFRLAKLLGVLDYIVVPNIVKLCERYCREMNLPDEIQKAVKTLISITNPAFPIRKHKECIPNYEARCMSIILFVMKLYFGMDGVTEYELSKYARLLNQKGCESNFFNLQEWLLHMKFRRFVIEQNHFPTYHETDRSRIDSDLYLQYIKSHDIHFGERSKLTKEMTKYKELLLRLKELQHDFITHLPFPPSLTPFRDYTRKIVEVFRDKYHSILKSDFSNDNIAFLKSHDIFLPQIGEEVRIKDGGANSNVILEKVKYRTMSNRLVCSVVELVDDSQKEDKNIFKKREFLKKKKKRSKFENESINEDVGYKIHYLPHKKYWLYNTVGLHDLAPEYFNPFLKKYPHTFMQVFEECCRIIEQTPADLFQTFQHTELCLVYLVDYSGDNREVLVDKKLLFQIREAWNCW